MEEVLDLQHKTDRESPDTNTDESREFSHNAATHNMLTHERHPRPLAALQRILLSFSPGERLTLYIFTAFLSMSTLALVIMLSTGVSATVPSFGGSLSEGSVGTPRFINPLLAISPTDQDLTILIYSGLVRVNNEGDTHMDLADRYEVSEDGTQYTLFIRPDATFHDGTPVSAADVAFTVALAQNPDIKSPRRADWEGVTVEARDERTIVFTLPHAYAPFLENTQLGILPKHVWEHVPIDEFPFHVLNTKPVGSGPYSVADIVTNDAGTPLSYTLTAFKEFTLGAPYVQTIVFHFYSNEETMIRAFAEGTIDSFAGISPDVIPLTERPDTRIVRAPSTRIFAVFLNQNHSSVLADASVREALTLGVDRASLIDSVLSGYGKPTFGPIPLGLRVDSSPSLPRATTTVSGIDGMAAVLKKGGWQFREPATTTEERARWKKKNSTLSFALSTADTPELVASANAVADLWRAAGIDVVVQIYPLTEFNTTVLRPREYDAVLFGQVVGRSLDLFAFWHSSQRNDPGLNLALYANTRADKTLASARTELNRVAREKLYASFAEIVAEDNPAVFLYSPDFVYVVPTSVQNLSLGALTTPSERFLNAYEWYTDTERVWDVFANRP